MATKKTAKRRKPAKKNPGYKTAKTGKWLDALGRQIKIERRNGRVNVLVRKKPTKRKR